MHGVDADGDAPSKRGGHAMCIDHENGVIYLLGGWDGRKSLDDFWAYDIREDRWRVLSHNTEREKNGPGARSCHKMVFDTKSGCIYLLGRLADGDGLKSRGEAPQSVDVGVGADGGGGEGEERSGDGVTTTAFCSEFYRYHTRGLDSGKWDLLSFDTAVSNRILAFLPSEHWVPHCLGSVRLVISPLSYCQIKRVLMAFVDLVVRA